jgi:hypothetical protein
MKEKKMFNSIETLFLLIIALFSSIMTIIHYINDYLIEEKNKKEINRPSPFRYKYIYNNHFFALLSKKELDS